MFRKQILLVLCGTSIAAAQSHSLSLDEAIRLAWANDPTVAALALSPQLANAREVQAGIAPNPQLEVAGALPLDTSSEWGLGIGIRQQIIPAERLELARALARVGGEASVHHLGQQRLAVAGLVRRLYYDLIVADTRRGLAAEAVKLPQELLQTAERLHARGEVAGADVEVVRLELARSRQSLRKAEAELSAAVERLRVRLRATADEALTTSTDLIALLSRELPEKLPALDDDAHPQLALVALEIREAAAALAFAKNKSQGEWALGAGLEFERRANDATGRLEDDPSVNVSASVPWKRRVPNRGDVLEKQAAIRIAEARLEGLRAELAMDIEAAWAAVRTLQPVVLGYRALIDESADLPGKLRASYERGEISVFDLIRAREQQLAVESDFLQSAAGYVAELAQAESALGLMPSQL